MPEDLMCGLTPFHVRRLCDDPFNHGGYQYTPNEVGDLTLDQIFMLLADRQDLRSSRDRTQRSHPLQVGEDIKKDEDGFILGRDESGKPMKAKIKGESLASRLNREEREKQAKSSGN